MIIATPGAPDANSYLTIREAEAFVANMLSAQGWPDDDELQEALLIQATTLADGVIKYHGVLASPDQALRVPREGLTDRDGRTYPADAVPERLKLAVLRLGMYQAQNSGSGQVAAGLTGLKVGPISLNFSDTVSTQSGMPSELMSMFEEFGDYVGPSNGGIHSVKAIRT